MGYESNLYIVEPPLRNEEGEPMMVHDGKAYCAVIAEFNMRKAGYDNPVAALIADAIKVEATRIDAEGWRHAVYECAEGDTQYDADKYGDPLAPLPLDRLIDALVQVSSGDVHYHRKYAPLLAMLRTFSDQIDAGELRRGVVVLHYGF